MKALLLNNIQKFGRRFHGLRSLPSIVIAGVLLSVFASLNAEAQITRPFTVRYSTNDNGDIKIVGNASLSCPLAEAGCANARNGVDTNGLNNNDFTMAYIDVDTNAATFNSSQATLSMPPGSTVKFAMLYWGARSTNAQRGTVLFQTPGSFGYSTVNASIVDTAAGSANNYAGSADVTAAVIAAGNGIYTVANIQANTGANNWAGWTLVVVYQNNSETLKNLVVYDGYGLVNNANPITVVPSGFLTPLSGPVTTRVGAAGFDGDLGLTGDGFSVNGTPLTDSLNQTNNFFNSVISENGVPLPGRTPSFTNNFGVDVDRVNVPTGVVPNGATSATLQLTAPNENYHPVVLTFVTDLYVPIITENVVKSVQDVNGAPLLAGDVMRWTIAMSNTGLDTGTNLILKDPIPANTAYVPGSLKIVTGANSSLVAKTDVAGDDVAEYSTVAGTCAPVAAPCVIFRLGSGATTTTGGELAFGESTSITFDTTVNTGLTAGTQITNSASISYSGQTLGATFSTTSASATGSVTVAPTISKAFSPSTISAGGLSTMTIVLSNPASNPVTLNGVSFSDTYPGLLVNATPPNTTVVCSSGSTSGTLTGGTAGGNSIGMSPGATIAPGGNCTISIQVTAPAGTYANTTSLVTSTNGGTGLAAAADTLYVGKISITKAFSAPVIEVGGASTITFVLTNNTGVAVTGVAFTDTYPGALQNAAGGTGTCNTGTVTAATGMNTFSLTGGSLAIGASCTITKNVTGAAPGGVFTNTTSGVTRTGDAVPGDPASAPYTVVAAPTVVKSFSPATVNQNDISQLQIVVTNPNATTTVSRTGVVFLDTYPGNLVNSTPASVTLNCTSGSSAAVTAATGAAGGGNIGLSNMTLAPGGSCTVTSNVLSTNAGNKTNASFTSTFDNAPDPASNAATLTVTAQTEPVITKSFLTDPIAVNGVSRMRIRIRNQQAGNGALTGVSFTDNYPVNLVNSATPAAAITANAGTCTLGSVTAIAGGTSLALSGLSISAGGDCFVEVNVTSAVAGPYFNTTGPFTTTSPIPAITPGTATLDVVVPPTITKTFTPSTIASGGSAVLTIVISNPPPNIISLAGVSFSDVFPTIGSGAPGNMTLANNTTSNTCTPGSTTGTLQDSGGGGIGTGDVGIRINPAAGATILPGGSCTITVNVTTSAAGNYTNTTSNVVSTTAGGLTGTTASAPLSVAKLSISKAFSPTSIPIGGTSTVTFTISNPTGSTQNGIAFTDNLLAAGLQMSSATVGGTCTGVVSNAAVNVTNFAVTAGSVPVAGCTITISVTGTAVGAHNNQASGVSYTGDPVPGSASNVATLIILTGPTVSKSFAPTVIAQNGTSLLTLSLTNPNPTDMTAASFTDTYPMNLFNAATPAGATTCPLGTVSAVAAAGTLALSGATIPANSTCVVTVNVTAATAGIYTNTLGVGALTTSGGSNAAAASAPLTVLSPPTVAKSFSPPSVAANEASTLTITLTNPNATAITGAAFTDTYPANLRNATVPNASTTCSGPVTATPNGTNPGVLTLTGGTIPANGSCTVTVSVVSTTNGNYTNNTGAVTTTNAGSGTSASAVLAVGVPNIAKQFSPTPVQLGQVSTLSFTLTNGTDTAMTAVAFSDTFPSTPAAMTVASPVTTTNTCGGTFAPTAGATSITFSGGSIPANSTCTVSVVVSVPVTGAAIGTYNNTSGAITAAGPLTGNTASASLSVIQAVPTVNKTFSGALAVGGTQTLLFLVSQPNGNPTQIFSFTDSLPPGLVVASPSTVGGTCSGGTVTATAGSGTITVTNRQIVNPATACTITVLVTTAASPTVGTCPQANNTNGNSNLLALTNVTPNVANVAVGGGSTTTGACITVVAAAPQVNKAFSGDLTVGGTSTLTFTVTQPTGNPTQTFSFTDTLPAGLVLAPTPAVGGTCTVGTTTANPGAGIFTVTNWAITNPATSCTITVNVSTAAASTVSTCPAANNTNGSANIGTATNITANVSNSATSGASTTGACVAVLAAIPTLNKSFGGSLSVGGTQSLIFTVNQPAGNPTQTFSFTDSLPAGLVVATPSVVGGTCTGGSVTATAGAGSIAIANRTITAGQTSCTITVNITTSATPTAATCPSAANTNGNAQIGATTNITAAIADVAFGGGSAGAAGSGACITVLAPATIAKAFSPATISAFGTSTVTLTLTNTNAVALTGASFTDTLSSMSIAATGTALGTCVGANTNNLTAGQTSLSFTGITIPASGSCTVTFVVTSSVVGVLPNTTSGVTSATTVAGAASNTANLTVNAPNLTLTKTNGTTTVSAGGTTTYTLTVANTGNAPTSGTITVVDVLPAGMTIAAGSVTLGGTNAANWTCTAAGQVITCTSATVIAAAGSSVFSFTPSISAGTTGTLTNPAQVGGGGDPTNPAAPTAATAGACTGSGAPTEGCAIDGPDTVNAPNLTLTKSTSSVFTVGSTASFTLVPQNTLGTAPTVGLITVADTLPAGLTYIAAGSGGAGWTCTPSGQVVTCTSSTVIAAGASGTPITINVSIGSNAAPGVTNTAQISGGGEPAVFSGNNSAVLMVAVSNMATNTFLTDGTQTGLPGTTVLYTHVFNAGLAGTVSFATSDVPSPAIMGWSTQIHRDLNCNGMLETGEGSTTLTGSVTVNPGDQVCLIVKSNIPATAPYNAQDVITVAATFTPVAGPNIVYTRQDITTVGSVGGAGLTLAKSVRNVTLGGSAGTSNTARPGDVLEYVITYTNTASSSVSTIVISDNTPSFTNYVSASCGAPLPTAITACNVTTQPAVGVGGNVQWTLTGALGGLQSGTVVFRVVVQ